MGGRIKKRVPQSLVDRPSSVQGILASNPSSSLDGLKKRIAPLVVAPPTVVSDVNSSSEGSSCEEDSASSMGSPKSLDSKNSARHLFVDLPEPELPAHQVLDNLSVLHNTQVSGAATILPALGPSWTNVVTNSRMPTEGLKLMEVNVLEEDFVLDPNDLVDVDEAWGHCLVGFYTSGFPGINAFHFMCNHWDVPYQYFRHASGWIVLKFTSEFDRDMVLKGGSYITFGSIFVTKPMPRCFEIDEANDLNRVPVWIKLPGLPADLWSENVLSKIVSRVGKPIATDFFTKARHRISYARVLVVVDASKELVQSINLRLLNDKVRVQKVEYEFVPTFCDKCKKLGHLKEDCDAHAAATLAREVARQRVRPAMHATMGASQPKFATASKPRVAAPIIAHDPVLVPVSAPVLVPNSAPVLAPKSAPVLAPISAAVLAPKPNSAAVLAPKSAAVLAPKSAAVLAPKSAAVLAPKSAAVLAPKSAAVLAPKSAAVLAPKTADVLAPKTAAVLAPKTAAVLAPKTAAVLAPKTAAVLAPKTAAVLAPKTAAVLAPKTAAVLAPKSAAVLAPKSAQFVEPCLPSDSALVPNPFPESQTSRREGKEHDSDYDENEEPYMKVHHHKGNRDPKNFRLKNP